MALRPRLATGLPLSQRFVKRKRHSKVNENYETVKG